MIIASVLISGGAWEDHEVPMDQKATRFQAKVLLQPPFFLNQRILPYEHEVWFQRRRLHVIIIVRVLIAGWGLRGPSGRDFKRKFFFADSFFLFFSSSSSVCSSLWLRSWKLGYFSEMITLHFSEMVILHRGHFPQRQEGREKGRRRRIGFPSFLPSKILVAFLLFLSLVLVLRQSCLERGLLHDSSFFFLSFLSHSFFFFFFILLS